MLVNCNTCQKKFVVPDSAITMAGRLVQCGSCGNKWTQFPIKKEMPTISKSQASKKTLIPTKVKKKVHIKKKREVNLYTQEYLQKKHGINIQNTRVSEKNKKTKPKFGFYGYLIVLIILMLTFFGILNISKEIIILKYPITDSYIYYFYETVNIIKVTLIELLNYFLD